MPDAAQLIAFSGGIVIHRAAKDYVIGTKHNPVEPADMDCLLGLLTMKQGPYGWRLTLAAPISAVTHGCGY
jgi:hypothetical protein